MNGKSEKESQVTIETESAAGVVLIFFDGEVDDTNYERFRDRILSEALGGATIVVLDLSAVTFFNSTGIRGLIAARKALDELAVELRLGPLSSIVERVL